ncbi:hypothetical protein HY989_01030 [Candidatus Micrarchaeota archaeon]|nr:hypothetical protein [Candidatus Micrarchaeota archaeon]
MNKIFIAIMAFSLVASFSHAFTEKELCDELAKKTGLTGVELTNACNELILTARLSLEEQDLDSELQVVSEAHAQKDYGRFAPASFVLNAYGSFQDTDQSNREMFKEEEGLKLLRSCVGSKDKCFVSDICSKSCKCDYSVGVNKYFVTANSALDYVCSENPAVQVLKETKSIELDPAKKFDIFSKKSEDYQKNEKFARAVSSLLSALAIAKANPDNKILQNQAQLASKQLELLASKSAHSGKFSECMKGFSDVLEGLATYQTIAWMAGTVIFKYGVSTVLTGGTATVAIIMSDISIHGYFTYEIAKGLIESYKQTPSDKMGARFTCQLIGSGFLLAMTLSGTIKGTKAAVALQRIKKYGVLDESSIGSKELVKADLEAKNIKAKVAGIGLESGLKVLYPSEIIARAMGKIVEKYSKTGKKAPEAFKEILELKESKAGPILKDATKANLETEVEKTLKETESSFSKSEIEYLDVLSGLEKGKSISFENYQKFETIRHNLDLELKNQQKLISEIKKIDRISPSIKIAEKDPIFSKMKAMQKELKDIDRKYIKSNLKLKDKFDPEFLRNKFILKNEHLGNSQRFVKTTLFSGELSPEGRAFLLEPNFLSSLNIIGGKWDTNYDVFFKRVNLAKILNNPESRSYLKRTMEAKKEINLAILSILGTIVRNSEERKGKKSGFEYDIAFQERFLSGETLDWNSYWLEDLESAILSDSKICIDKMNVVRDNYRVLNAIKDVDEYLSVGLIYALAENTYPNLGEFLNFFYNRGAKLVELRNIARQNSGLSGSAHPDLLFELKNLMELERALGKRFDFSKTEDIANFNNEFSKMNRFYPNSKEIIFENFKTAKDLDYSLKIKLTAADRIPSSQFIYDIDPPKFRTKIEQFTKDYPKISKVIKKHELDYDSFILFLTNAEKLNKYSESHLALIIEAMDRSPDYKFKEAFLKNDWLLNDVETLNSILKVSDFSKIRTRGADPLVFQRLITLSNFGLLDKSKLQEILSHLENNKYSDSEANFVIQLSGVLDRSFSYGGDVSVVESSTWSNRLSLAEIRAVIENSRKLTEIGDFNDNYGNNYYKTKYLNSILLIDKSNLEFILDRKNINLIVHYAKRLGPQFGHNYFDSMLRDLPDKSKLELLTNSEFMETILNLKTKTPKFAETALEVIILGGDSRGRIDAARMVEGVKIASELDALGIQNSIPIVFNHPESSALLKKPRFKEYLAKQAREIDTQTVEELVDDYLSFAENPRFKGKMELVLDQNALYRTSPSEFLPFAKNFLDDPQATELAFKYGQLNDFTILKIREAMDADKSAGKSLVEKALSEGIYGVELVDVSTGKKTITEVLKQRDLGILENKPLVAELELKLNKKGLPDALRQTIDRYEKNGVKIALTSGSARNPILNLLGFSKDVEIKDIDIILQEVTITASELKQLCANCDSAILSKIIDRLKSDKMTLPALYRGMAEKIRIFDDVAADKLAIRRARLILESELGTLFKDEFGDFYKDGKLSDLKIAEILKDENLESTRVMKNIVLLLEDITRAKELGNDIRGDASAVTRGDAGINAMLIFKDSKGKLKISDPENAILDAKRGEIKISKGLTSVYGERIPINTMVTSTTEAAVADYLRLLKLQGQFGLKINADHEKIILSGVNYMNFKSVFEPTITNVRVKKNAAKVLSFLEGQDLSSAEVRAVVKKLASVFDKNQELVAMLEKITVKGIRKTYIINAIYPELSLGERKTFLEKGLSDEFVFHGTRTQTVALGEVSLETSSSAKGIIEAGMVAGIREAYGKGVYATNKLTTALREYGQADSNPVGVVMINKNNLFNLKNEIGQAREIKILEKVSIDENWYVALEGPGEAGKTIVPLSAVHKILFSADMYFRAKNEFDALVEREQLSIINDNPDVSMAKLKPQLDAVRSRINEEKFGAGRTFEDVVVNVYDLDLQLPEEYLKRPN